jgi:hypothetical protein
LAAYVSMADTGLPVEIVNLLLANALHFVVHIEIVDGVRRIVSVREVVDAEGGQIISNEVFARSAEGVAIAAAPLRDASALLFEQHGFDARAHRRSDAWGSR